MTHAPDGSHISERLEPALDELEATANRRGCSGKPDTTYGIPTGHADLDELLGGLRHGLVHLVAGYPGVGTSTFALGLARAAALRHQLPTLYLSAQSPGQLITHRILSAEARVALNCILSGGMNDDDWSRMARKMREVGNAPLVIDDLPYRDFAAVPLKHGLDGDPWRLIVVDGTNILARPTAPEQLWTAHNAGISRHQACGPRDRRGHRRHGPHEPAGRQSGRPATDAARRRVLQRLRRRRRRRHRHPSRGPVRPGVAAAR